jgi:hypothetical protein
MVKVVLASPNASASWEIKLIERHFLKKDVGVVSCCSLGVGRVGHQRRQTSKKLLVYSSKR